MRVFFKELGLEGEMNFLYMEKWTKSIDLKTKYSAKILSLASVELSTNFQTDNASMSCPLPKSFYSVCTTMELQGGVIGPFNVDDFLYRTFV